MVGRTYKPRTFSVFLDVLKANALNFSKLLKDYVVPLNKPALSFMKTLLVDLLRSIGLGVVSGSIMAVVSSGLSSVFLFYRIEWPYEFFVRAKFLACPPTPLSFYGFCSLLV